ncbi:MAG: rubrerythrin [Candidatus Bipolaricaulota bacterium]
MPPFGAASSGRASDRKLPDQGLIRAIRSMSAAEYATMGLSMRPAEPTHHASALDVLKDIADEKRVHAGEFLRLLVELAAEAAAEPRPRPFVE